MIIKRKTQRHRVSSDSPFVLRFNPKVDYRTLKVYNLGSSLLRVFCTPLKSLELSTIESGRFLLLTHCPGNLHELVFKVDGDFTEIKVCLDMRFDFLEDHAAYLLEEQSRLQERS